MKIVLVVLGVYMSVVGLLLCVAPTLGKRLTEVWMKDKISRGWALVTLGVGALLICAASASRAPIYIYVLGWTSVAKGVYLVIAPRPQLLRVVTWWHGLSQGFLRLWGVVALGMGAAILLTL